MYRVTQSPSGGTPAPQATNKTPKVLGQLTQAMGTFSDDQRGSVAIMFGLMSLVMFMFIGAAVDIGRWMQVRKTTEEAIQVTNDATAAIATAMSNYNFNKAKSASITATSAGPIGFKLISQNTAMTVTGNIQVATPFLSLASVKSLNVLRADTSENAIAKMNSGGNSGTSIELSVMIDITGSMAQSDNSGSTKIATVKAAAANLVDIIVWADQTQQTSKIAIVPFSEAVKLSASAAALAHGTTASGASTSPGAQTYNLTKSQTTVQCTGSGKKKVCKDVITSTVTPYMNSELCVTERTDLNAYTDVSPANSPVGRLYSTDGWCATTTEVMPLSNDKTALKAKINSLTASGGTAGQMGSAWAWYMLSPNFNSLWPTSSAARPYSDLDVKNAQGAPVLKKFAILMTDGDYNTEYCDGVSTADESSCTPTNGTSVYQAGKLCTAMKAKGIEVFTIGAQVSSSAKTFLQGCATDPSHYYDATDGNKMQQAFAAIAQTLVKPYLAH
jgi:Flp pilus assembly protein TadG